MSVPPQRAPTQHGYYHHHLMLQRGCHQWLTRLQRLQAPGRLQGIPTECLVQNQRMELPRVAYECSPGAPNFNACGNGRFHLKGVTISEVQADNIFDFKKNKPALAAKEIAQALWGSELFAQRTYGGKVAPKDRKNPDAKPRKELSPDKVSLVIETLSHWGMVKKIDVAPALANLSTILSENIQDTRKGIKRWAIAKEF
ncbi:unnamed protein product [Ixodes hexagonus]